MSMKEALCDFLERGSRGDDCRNEREKEGVKFGQKNASKLFKKSTF